MLLAYCKSKFVSVLSFRQAYITVKSKCCRDVLTLSAFPINFARKMSSSHCYPFCQQWKIKSKWEEQPLRPSDSMFYWLPTPQQVWWWCYYYQPNIAANSKSEFTLHICVICSLTLRSNFFRPIFAINASLTSAGCKVLKNDCYSLFYYIN